MASNLHGVRADVSSDNFLPARENPVHSFSLPPSMVRLWGLARWGHDLFLGLPLALSAMMWMVLLFITSPLAPPTSMLVQLGLLLAASHRPTNQRLHGTVGCSTPSTSGTRHRQSGPTFLRTAPTTLLVMHPSFAHSFCFLGIVAPGSFSMVLMWVLVWLASWPAFCGSRAYQGEGLVFFCSTLTYNFQL